MKKEMVEMYIFELGDILDIRKCNLDLRDSQNSSKNNHYKESNGKIMIVGVERRVPKTDRYACLLNTGKLIGFSGEQLNNAKYVGNADISMLFKGE